MCSKMYNQLCKVPQEAYEWKVWGMEIQPSLEKG